MKYPLLYPAATVVLLLIGAAAPIAAQGVVGHLYDFESGVVVATADVVMTNEAGDTVGRVVSDADGRFIILVDVLGEYSLLVSRLGYVPQVSAQIHLEDETLQDLEITIRPEAIGIEGLVVSTTPVVRALHGLGYYERKEHGVGDFIQPSELEKMQAFSTSGLLRSVPGLMVRDGIVRTMRRAVQGPNLAMGPCALKVLVNGVDVGIDLDSAIQRYTVSAIEVYKSLASVPPQYLGSVSTGVDGERTCGAVLVWTVFGG